MDIFYNHLSSQVPDPLIGVRLGGRLLVFTLGLLLCGWTLIQLRRRTLLISLSSLFITIGALLILFAFFPFAFNQFAYWLGVQYPPLLYLVGAVVILMLVNVHLASRLSMVDMRCRLLAQELALQKAEMENVRSR